MDINGLIYGAKTVPRSDTKRVKINRPGGCIFPLVKYPRFEGILCHATGPQHGQIMNYHKMAYFRYNYT